MNYRVQIFSVNDQHPDKIIVGYKVVPKGLARLFTKPTEHEITLRHPNRKVSVVILDPMYIDKYEIRDLNEFHDSIKVMHSKSDKDWALSFYAENFREEPFTFLPTTEGVMGSRDVVNFFNQLIGREGAIDGQH